jgi:hypothetical protein
MTPTIRVLTLAFAALLLLVAAACKSSGGNGGGGDDTNREITEDELAQMVLALADFGGAYGDFLVDEGNGAVTPDAKAEDDFDPKDEANDLVEHGYVSGYDADFLSPDAEASGVYAVGSEVNLYEDADGAAGYFADTKAEIEDAVGNSGDEMDVTSVEPFSVDVGDESAGFALKGTLPDDEGNPVDVWLMTVGFRHGRLIGSVYMGSLEERDSREGLRGWARVMDQRMGTVLAGSSVSDDETEDGGDDSTGDTGGDDPIDLVSADPVAVLAESARSFEEEVTSLEMEMVMTFASEGFTIDASAEMVFQAPDSMYMTIDMGILGSAEMLVLGDEMYMNIPGQGWVVFSLEELLGGMSLDELGFDSGALEEQWSEHSLIDLQAVFEGLGGTIEDLGDETIDGKTLRHYRGLLDVAAAAAALGDMGGFDFESVDIGEVNGPISFDFWFDPETLLPHRMTMHGEVSAVGEEVTMDIDVMLTGYNEPVTIPDAPADATSLTDLFGAEGY